MNSILTSIKKLLGIPEEYEQFDADLIMHVNSVLFILNQLGVGPQFTISSKDETWQEYLGEELIDYEAVKSYVHLKVKLLFDPPQSSAVAEAIKNMISELEYRLYVVAENKQ
ncbi:MAG: hypothetical protein KBT06_03530 [Prevotellaceae bacterium]|nr:hypothetical protein [Candidatus Colivivens equi]